MIYPPLLQADFSIRTWHGPTEPRLADLAAEVKELRRQQLLLAYFLAKRSGGVAYISDAELMNLRPNDIALAWHHEIDNRRHVIAIISPNKDGMVTENGRVNVDG